MKPNSHVCASLLALISIAADAPPADFDAQLLAAHNAERAAMGAPPLTWDARLAADAKAWARTLAAKGAFEHAAQDKDGENLWAGTKGFYAPQQMVGSWIDEKKTYTAGRFPNVSTTGNWMDVGHYTQLIWAKTARVGCGMATGAEEDVLVCRYSPAGNWMGQLTIEKPVVVAPLAPPVAPKAGKVKKRKKR